MYANLLWRERGSNPRRADYDSTVLPTELSRQRIVQCIMHKHIVSFYLRMFVCALNPLHQITKMHNDIYIWSLWYVCLFVHCIHCTKCTKCVQLCVQCTSILCYLHSVYNDDLHCVYYVHVCISMCTCVCMCVHVCTWCVVHLCACVCMCVYMCVHVCVCVCTLCVPMFVYMHIRACLCS